MEKASELKTPEEIAREIILRKTEVYYASYCDYPVSRDVIRCLYQKEYLFDLIVSAINEERRRAH
jgi:hypothetical protein